MDGRRMKRSIRTRASCNNDLSRSNQMRRHHFVRKYKERFDITIIEQMFITFPDTVVLDILLFFPLHFFRDRLFRYISD